jgi:toxin ParE1/3/4
MSVRFSARALADLRAIADYIAERRPSGAVSVIRRIEATVALIGRHPGVGRKVRARSGVFALPVGKYPYRVYYMNDGNNAIVVHVRHAARKLPSTEEMV